jgi:hypothetical protein
MPSHTILPPGAPSPVTHYPRVHNVRLCSIVLARSDKSMAEKTTERCPTEPETTTDQERDQTIQSVTTKNILSMFR